MIGQSISQYKILEKLGEGGMGVVYKAQDTKLDRFVALKCLPDRVNKDATSKTRFLQEAKAVAGLNHPNICTIFGVEEIDHQLFMAMEYVEGGTLSEKIPFAKADDAITMAVQIADALQEAHTKGIVHRDIKSDNIMLTSKGQVKVMDFGLAKLKGAMKLTRTSSTVGTLGYMAPEQIQGGEVDHRSDIFSFGVLLFQMLVGRLPFRGEHEAAMVYSIVNEEPQNIAQLLPELSPIVVNLITRCLEKDPQDRYQHFDDIVADLRRAQKKTSKVMRSSAYQSTASDPQPASRIEIPIDSPESTKRSRIGMYGGGIGLIIVVVAGWFFFKPSVTQLNQNMAVSQLQIPATEFYAPDISSDGKWMAFPGADLNGMWDIYMMSIETGESKRITNDSTVNIFQSSTASFSPDGSFIAYGRRTKASRITSVCVVSVLSGQVKVVADTGISPQWNSADGRIYYYRGKRNSQSRSGFREYWSVSRSGGDARREFVDSTDQGLTYFSFSNSPNGKEMIFTRAVTDKYNEIIVRDLGTGAERQLTHDQRVIDDIFWADNGYILYSSNRNGNFNIWAVPEQGGDAVQVTKGAGPDGGISYSSAANRLIYYQRTPMPTSWIVNTDGTGNRQLFPEDNILESYISPNGKTLVTRVSHPTMQATLMLRDISGGGQDLLFPYDSTFGRDNAFWSPDGKRIVFLEYTLKSNAVRSKVIDIAGGRTVMDLGFGVSPRWISDSTVLTYRDTSGNVTLPQYNFPKEVNVYTGSETVATVYLGNKWPVLNNTKVIVDRKGGLSIFTMKEYTQNPTGDGTPLIQFAEMTSGYFSDKYIYYSTASKDALMKLDFNTLTRSKITDLRPADNIVIEYFDYNDKVLTYAVRKIKTNIVKIDNVFMKK